MKKKERIHYNTTLDVKLLKKLKFLSIEENKRHNDLLEEAIELLLKNTKIGLKNNPCRTAYFLTGKTSFLVERWGFVVFRASIPKVHGSLLRSPGFLLR
jgi:hypothetical protein